MRWRRGPQRRKKRVTPLSPEKEKPEEEPEEALPEPEPVVIPNPNGIYLPTGEKYPKGRETHVYANGEGFFMWFNGSIWKITDKVGGGRTVSTGEENINDKWTNSGKASHYPDKSNEKDALFRLAVAYQGPRTTTRTPFGCSSNSFVTFLTTKRYLPLT